MTISSGAGKVWLVGAGPGDPELLTLKAVRVLRSADVWLVDDLVGEGVLAFAAPNARIVRVGKRGGCRSTPQAFILRLMRRYAIRGAVVARVKGGDPFVFGRGGEELAWLAAHGIAAEAVAGLTAGLAVGAALGLPLTHRGVARGVTLITAHQQDGGAPDWRALAASGMTVVCYMGMSDIGGMQQSLLSAGFASDLPVAVVQRVSCPDQREAFMTVATLAVGIAQHGLASPAVIVIGESVGCRANGAHAGLYVPAADITAGSRSQTSQRQMTSAGSWPLGAGPRALPIELMALDMLADKTYQRATR